MDIWRRPPAPSSLAGVESVLVAEPEPDTRAYLERNLREDGFSVLGAEREIEALALAERRRPDVVLAAELDLLSRIRSGEPGRSWNCDVPLIVLASSEGDPAARVRALERGADDVVERPIVYLELVARIRALLRRTRRNERDVLHAGDVTVERSTRVARVRGTPVRLAGKEFELLAALAAEPRRVFTKDELLRDVWGFRSAGRTRTLDSHASRLRRKLALEGGDRFVHNVWGVGYRLLD
jgi:DNA-binding response OmpR family regulator